MRIEISCPLRITQVVLFASSVGLLGEAGVIRGQELNLIQKCICECWIHEKLVRWEFSDQGLEVLVVILNVYESSSSLSRYSDLYSPLLPSISSRIPYAKPRDDHFPTLALARYEGSDVAAPPRGCRDCRRSFPANGGRRTELTRLPCNMSVNMKITKGSR